MAKFKISFFERFGLELLSDNNVAFDINGYIKALSPKNGKFAKGGGV